MTTEIWGLDGGITGAMAFLSPMGELETYDYPIFEVAKKSAPKKLEGKQPVQRLLDVGSLSLFLRDRRNTLKARGYHNAVAYFERGQGTEQQGIQSLYLYAFSNGTIYGILYALGIPTTLVDPTPWKRYHKLIGGTKDDSRRRASQIWPECAWQWPLQKNHGRAESGLIAMYGEHLRRQA